MELESFERTPTIVAGGLRRQDSVSRGLTALPPVQIVAIHDAARPFAEPDLLLRGVELIENCDGAIPGLPVTDTIKLVDELGAIISTVEREPLRSVQTPQVFRCDSLVAAHLFQRSSQRTLTDDASLVEACGGKVQVFPGQWGNFKITTEYDLELARLLIADTCPA
jgi:2-C-methyl-D-erythritol 4-phosphate cytidylyltransferase/2-C-methyl-D-erythritol 2,4-cyclodiphosphate synthase